MSIFLNCVPFLKWFSVNSLKTDDAKAIPGYPLNDSQEDEKTIKYALLALYSV